MTTTTDESILKEMLERSCNPEKKEVDNISVQMFCMVVKSNAALIPIAHEMIVKKIGSKNITEATRAIEVLEDCMSHGGEEFQKKTAKFVFINQLIALVLDLTGNEPVPVETKKRIMECLMLLTAEHSDKKKFRNAYDKLKTQVNFDHGPSMTTVVNANAATSPISNGGAAAREQRISILGKDEQLVEKLLKQGGEENYKKANLVIQHRFNQEAKRVEFICHLKSELAKIERTMQLLDEMMDSNTPGGNAQDSMLELYNMCQSHSEQMARWPDFLADAEPDFLDDVQTTKDLLAAVVQRYEEMFKSKSNVETSVAAAKAATQLLQSTKATVLPTTTTAAATSTTTTDILSELLGDVLSPLSSSSKADKEDKLKDNNAHTPLDDLSEIFGGIEIKTDRTNYPTDLLGNFNLLEPISVFGSETNTAAKEAAKADNDEEMLKPQGFKELREIDKLSEEMFKQSLQTEQRQATFKKEPEKITLNDLARDKIQTSLKTGTSKSNGSDKHSSECRETTEKSSPVLDNNVELQGSVEKQEDVLETLKLDAAEKPLDVSEQKEKNVAADIKRLPVKPLAEITIELDELTSIPDGQRMLLDDEDIEVSLNLTADRPSEHVSVIVIMVTNKSRLPVYDVQFEASVKKPSKVRLLPPTSTAMAPRKPYRPPEVINQVILLMNPTQKAVDITCMLGYKLGDDPDPIKEPMVAKDIPYV